MGTHQDLPLRCLAHTRSGDKGNISNIAVFAQHPAFHAVLREQLTVKRVAARYGALVKGRITRYEAENLHAFNFVCEGALGGGVSRSLYLDNYGKALSSALLDVSIALPLDLWPLVEAHHLHNAGLQPPERPCP